MTLARPAHADPTEDEIRDARALFTSAEHDEDGERWQDALDKLHRIAQVKLTAGIHYHLALCEEHLGRLASALADYIAAKDEATQSDAQDVLRLVGPQLAALTPRVPHLTFQADPSAPNTAVTLDGVAVTDRLDVRVPVDPGLHRVEASAPGRITSSVTVEVHEGDATVFRLSLQPLAATESSLRTAAGSDVLTHPTHAPIAAILATAGAAALIGIGVGAYLEAGGAHQDAVRECPGMTSCPSLIATVRAWDWTALGAWGAAGSAVTLATLLWTQHGPSPAPTHGARVLLGPGSVGVAGSF